jgi:hypothetical protein
MMLRRVGPLNFGLSRASRRNLQDQSFTAFERKLRSVILALAVTRLSARLTCFDNHLHGRFCLRKDSPAFDAR